MSTTRTNFIKIIAAALAILSAALCTTAVVAQNKVTVRPAEKTAPQQSTPNAPPAAASSSASTSSTETPKPEGEKSDERFFYDFKQPDFVVNNIQIEHDAAGRGTVKFTRKGDEEPLVEPLELAPATLARVNALWAALDYLSGDVNLDTGNTKLANVGTKQLRVRRNGRERATEFIYSINPQATQLADEYRRVAEQTILVFDLGVARENRPLDMPKLLDRLEILLRLKGLSDPQQLVPLLRDLSTDERLPLIARNQIGRILKKIAK